LKVSFETFLMFSNAAAESLVLAFGSQSDWTSIKRASGEFATADKANVVGDLFIG
jgi:hypothetical protein